MFQIVIECIMFQSLQSEEYKAIFIGIGLPEAKCEPFLEGLTEEMGFYTSKSFLPKVSSGSKKGIMCSTYFTSVWWDQEALAL